MKPRTLISFAAVIAAATLGMSHATSAARAHEATRGSLGLKYPAGIALDTHGNVYVTDFGNNRVVKLSPKGKLVSTVGSSSGLKNPMAVAVAPDGTVYVADTGNRRVLAFDSTGAQTRVLTGTGFDGSSPFIHPTGLSVAPNGTLYIADSGKTGITWWNPDGSESGWNDEYHPSAVLVYGKIVGSTSPLPGSGRPTVAELDYNLGTLVINPPNNDPVTWNTYTRPGSDTGLARDKTGAFYVADNVSSVVKLVIKHGGSSHVKWARAGKAGKFSHPVGVAVDKHNDVYITDSWNNRIVKLTPKGKLVAVWH